MEWGRFKASGMGAGSGRELRAMEEMFKWRDVIRGCSGCVWVGAMVETGNKL